MNHSEFNLSISLLDERKKSTFFQKIIHFFKKSSLDQETSRKKRFHLFKKPSEDRKFQIILTYFLSISKLQNFYFENLQKRKHFLSAIKRAARLAFSESFYNQEFSLESQALLSQLTTLPGENYSLLLNKKKLKSQLARIDATEREYLLFLLLNELERNATFQNIEVSSNSESTTVSFKKEFGKCSLLDFQFSQPFYCNKSQNRAKPYLHFHNHLIADQHLLSENESQKNRIILSSCGNLETPKKVLEQILFLLEISCDESIKLTSSQKAEEKFSLCFTSFYNWYELDLILAERSSIEALHGKTLEFTNLKKEKKILELQLFHYNIPLSGSLEPLHTKAMLKDLRDETLLAFCDLFFQREKPICCPKILSLFINEPLVLATHSHPYLEKQKILLEKIDRFRSMLPELKKELSLHPSALAKSILSLINHSQNEKSKEIEEVLILYKTLVLFDIHFNQNSNQLCKILAAEASIKAQCALEKMYGTFLSSSHYHNQLSSLYTDFLLSESTQLHVALSSGIFDESFFLNEFKKNRELNHFFDIAKEEVHFLRCI